MPDVDIALAANLAAARDFLDLTDRLGGVWAVPRAPGKWSPAQLLEHLVQTHIVSGKIIKGQPVAVPSIPWFLRPLLRRFWLRRILGSGEINPMKTTPPLAAPDPPPH